MMCPKQSICSVYSLHFFHLRYSFYSFNWLNTIRRWLSCSSIVSEYTNMSLRYTCIHLPMTSWNMDVISHWNVARALQSPCCIMWLTYIPHTVEKAVFHMSSATTHTCLYASDRSIFDLYFMCATSSLILSWFSIGVTSFIVLWCFHCTGGSPPPCIDGCFF